MPHNLVGKALTLFASDAEVRLVDVAEQVAVHHRCFGRRQTIESASHRRALVDAKRRAKEGARRDELSQRVLASVSGCASAYAEGAVVVPVDVDRRALAVRVAGAVAFDIDIDVDGDGDRAAWLRAEVDHTSRACVSPAA